MIGFFSKEETQSIHHAEGRILTCASCGLYQNIRSPRMEPYGNFNKGIMVIGEAPNELEDTRGKPWQGPAGRALQAACKRLGISLFEDCINVNAVACCPMDKKGANRSPTASEITNCRVKVVQAVMKYRPKVILLLGGGAVQSLLSTRWTNNLGGVSKWRGWTIPDHEYGAWICPTYHPSYFLHQREVTQEVERIWLQDLRQAFAKVEEPLPPAVSVEDSVTIAETEEDGAFILSALLAKAPPLLAIDIETTGLKPYDRDVHRIVTISFAHTPDHAFAIPMPTQPHGLQLLKQVLEHPAIGKIAANMKFEDAWLSVLHGIQVRPWQFDTMQAAHILDNRPGINGLKFQSFVRFGVAGYDDDIASYLKSPGANQPNALAKEARNPALLHKLMQYNGMDALLTYQLAEAQIADLNEKQRQSKHIWNAYHLVHDGILALSRAEQQGMRVDVTYCDKMNRQLTKRIERLEKQFQASRLWRRWRRVYGEKTKLSSNHQLAQLLYKVMKLAPPKTTATGQGATDEEALLALGISELQLLVQARKLSKVRDTYLEAFVREQHGGWIHPFFNLHTVRTYRSSSDSPNLQNVPKRDAEAMNICRRALLPRPGHQFVEIDFASLEVHIAALYCQDATLIAYLKDSSSDMHADMAKQLFLLDDLDRKLPAHAVLRQAAKNGFVFPQFYGDYYKNNAVTLADWVKLPQDSWAPGTGLELPDGSYLSDHMRARGIHSFTAFVDHVQCVEDDFWNNRFKQYRDWRMQQVARYRAKGFLTMLTGFVCSGELAKNEILNYPIQGTAFHCLLQTFINMDRYIQQERMQSRLVGQIHDSILIDAHPQEVDLLVKEARRIVKVDLPTQWKWITVPLEVDVDRYAIDGPWVKGE